MPHGNQVYTPPIDSGQNSVMCENLSLADEVRPQDDIIARWAIISAFEVGACTATDAYDAIVKRGLFGDIDEFMATYAAGVRAISSGAAR